MTSIETSPCAFNKKTTRTRKLGNVKLRFHHQALPQEYLDHYEATQSQFQTKEMSIGLNARTTKKERTTTSTVPSPSCELGVNEQQTQDERTDKSAQLWLQKTLKHQNGSNSKLDGEQMKVTQKPSAKAHDLPYMGEITLDNFKPRRGRKPKKADICHLIYKNYGTLFPSQKSDEVESECASNSAAINQSLLEKRLTQNSDDKEAELNDGSHGDTEEPLNLCVRDRYDCDILTVISDDGAADNDNMNDFKPEMLLLSNDQMAATNFPRNMKMALPNFQSALLDSKSATPETAMDMDVDINNYNCWQNSNMLLNPMVLYLQKIANSNAPSTLNQNATEKDTSANSKDTSLSQEKSKRVLVPKKIAQLLKDDSSKAEVNRSTPAATTNKANQKGTPKRKRSAIFIPPLPEESSTNHATEVSICKFKFTGGAKPSLQEKKMLSVDAGGNFRYYSGTGDKSIRGYEFFPRESLKQSSLMSASSAGAFLNTPGQKIANDIPPPSFGLSNEILQIPEMQTPNPIGIHSSPNAMNQHPVQHSKQHYHSSRKRKSKRSMQREKLEKTFKEKGFLIQTQQLEQAEGTYCKFRQLRKFTRYLFRSWKDYLPGELQQNQANMAGISMNQTGSTSSAVDHDTTSSHLMPSPSPSPE